MLAINNPEIKETGDRLSEHVENLRADVAQVAEDLKSHLAAHADLAIAKAGDGYAQLRMAAEEKLFICAGVAFAMGFLFASLRARS